MGDIFSLSAIQPRLAERDDPRASYGPTLPPHSSIQAAESSLPDPQSPNYLQGQPPSSTASHIIRDIVPALTGQARSSRYYGFVTGGVLPIAEWADNVVSRTDQNVQVHLPAQTAATAVEDAALEMLVRLLRLHVGGATWAGRTFTTGATASNILGLACGREIVVNRRLGGEGVGELGLLAACARAGVEEIQVLTSAGHSSLSKAASVVGLGRRSVKELALSENQPWRLDIDALEGELRRRGTASIIAITAGDVNTGGYALQGPEEWKRVRELADTYGAWIHVDGGKLLVCVSAHKMPLLTCFSHGCICEGSRRRTATSAAEAKNRRHPTSRQHHTRRPQTPQRSMPPTSRSSVRRKNRQTNQDKPYDCGIFFTRSASTLSSVFVNPNAAYLASSAAATIPSPLNIGLENSRRFRALPAYAVLLSEGRPGIAKLLSNMIALCRKLAAYLRESPHYELLPDESAPLDGIFMTLLFRARSKDVNDALVDRINRTREMYVSGTKWKGEAAVRVAVSNWKVHVDRDFAVVTQILDAVAEGRECSIESTL
ncbi:tyrosine decarboxylase, putative [Metarhizium acridum CQMa 102]|uniref:Tyrosine decarboxylase, putative n=1 Tax=Metarhizium acridum (strain CQMa 102) TaxID=655827 RepID=E9DRG9_METAQ|nr:tyrosine decarboxylase, putative [Metarhizium acridum CQMa 102]EFY93847.1 tyrosine decarboxylase, putative [Metarhizium acridum CQMa 102]